MDKVESMVAAMRRHLETSDAIDRRLPMHVGLASLDNYACNIHIVVRILPMTFPKFLLSAPVGQISRYLVA